MGDLINRASDHVISLFQSKLPVQYHYHTLEHTISVVDYCSEIATAMNISESEMELLLVAAWFHDSGYTQTYRGHEAASCVIARSFLDNIELKESDLEIILGCIMATQVPQVPKGTLQEIICDADLVYLGTPGFDKWNNRLRLEWQHAIQKTYTDKEWLQVNIDFITGHSFHTAYCIEHYDPLRRENLRDYQEQWEKL